MTGVILYRPSSGIVRSSILPISLTERSPSKSSSIVVVPPGASENGRFSLTSPDGISTDANVSLGGTIGSPGQRLRAGRERNAAAKRDRNAADIDERTATR